MSDDMNVPDAGREDLLERLYEEALGLPEEERNAFLDRACAGDPELRAELASLLVEGAGARTFMDDLGRLVPPSGDAPPDRLVSALADRYRIEERVGAGGMATVYRARDLRHERKVALKVLKPELAAIVGGERFLAEIKTTANLQHPNILPLFDSGEAGGYLYYVMPYVEGESLRARLDREAQLPVDEAVRIATSMAEALDYAHRQGVIHRDIKPANVLLQDGKPVVADFGIALAVRAGGGDRLTETGLSLGTPHYMSPEQATGDQHIGPATDIYAVGCVLYEMLVGEPPFTGSTPQAVLGRIIASEPVSASAARGTVPIHVDAVIRRAIERVPADRFRRAADFARALADPGFGHGPPVSVPATSVGPWRRLAIAMGLLAALSTGLLVPMVLRRDRPAPVIRYELTFAAGEAPPTSGTGPWGPSFALSDDGSTMAYVGPSAQRGSQIWIRERDSETGMPIAGTEGGIQPFFSPDGRRVGFLHLDAFELRIVSLEGGPPLTLVGTGLQRSGAAWGPDGYVYYIGEGLGLYRVPATGGEGEEVAPARPDERVIGYAWPDVLPGGRGVLVTLRRGAGNDSERDVGVIDLESGRLHPLVEGVLGRYLPTGHLIYVTRDGDLVAAPFDEGELRVTGPAVPLESGLPQLVPGPDLALSRSGRLLYQSAPGPTRQELVWVDRSGRVVPVEPGWTFVPNPNGEQPTLSPGDRQIALDLIPDRGPGEIWVKQIDGGRFRLPFDGLAARPTWSPDGEAVVFLSDVPSLYDVWTRRADASGDPELLVDIEEPIAHARWAPDGTWLLLRTPRGVGYGDVLGFSPGNDASARPLVATENFEAAPMLSPDGRFLAYVSQESGAFVDVHVRPYPGLDDARFTVSLDGGIEPVWSHSGQELFYKKSTNVSTNEWAIVAVRIDTREGFQILGQDTLFTIPPGPSSAWDQTYDVTEDGQRFLMFRYVDGESQPGEGKYHVVENFDQELLRRMGN